MAEPDIRQALTQAGERWNAAFNSGNAEAVAALYTPDGTVLPHTHAVVKGAAAIKEFWSGLMSAGVKEHGIELLDAAVLGDAAYAYGKWWAIGPGEGGATQRYEGTITTIFRKGADGSWKTCLHTWN
jgi:uncharacterized protein (TIGR02246 family)